MNRGGPFHRGRGCISCLGGCLGAMLLPQSYQYPNLSEGADRVGEQLRGDRERPFSDVTKSGRVWRKVPESDVRSVVHSLKNCSTATFSPERSSPCGAFLGCQFHFPAGAADGPAAPYFSPCDSLWGHGAFCRHDRAPVGFGWYASCSSLPGDVSLDP